MFLYFSDCAFAIFVAGATYSHPLENTLWRLKPTFRAAWGLPLKSDNFKFAAFLFLDISKQLWCWVQQIRIQCIQFFFHTLGCFQIFRLSECEISALLMPHFSHEPDVLRRLFRRYFLQIFDLRAFCFFHREFIIFWFSFVLRAF